MKTHLPGTWALLCFLALASVDAHATTPGPFSLTVPPTARALGGEFVAPVVLSGATAGVNLTVVQSSDGITVRLVQPTLLTEGAPVPTTEVVTSDHVRATLLTLSPVALSATASSLSLTVQYEVDRVAALGSAQALARQFDIVARTIVELHDVHTNLVGGPWQTEQAVAAGEDGRAQLSGAVTTVVDPSPEILASSQLLTYSHRLEIWRRRKEDRPDTPAHLVGVSGVQTS